MDEEVVGLEDFEKATSELFLVLIKPKGFRQRFLRWLYPELVKVADTLKKCYWSAKK